MTRLPNGWTECRLDECSLNLDSRRVPVNRRDRAPRQGHIPYYGATGQVGWIDSALFDEELVLLGEDGAPFFEGSRNKAYLISGPSWVNNHAHVLRGTTVSNRYLMHFLNSIDYRGLVNGTTRPKLTQSAMNSINVPVPPPAEQDRMVAAIEEEFSRLDAAFTPLERAGRRLVQLRRSLIRQAIAGGLIEGASGWPRAALARVAQVGSGATPLRSNLTYWEGGTIPWVTTTLINRSVINEPTSFITEKALAETAVKVWPPGTLLVAMYGEGQTRGRCAELAIHATCNQACAAIVLRDEYAYIRPLIRLYFEDSYERNRRLGIGGVQPNLSLGQIKEMEVPVPSPEELIAVLPTLHDQLTVLTQIAEVVDQQARRLAALRSSMLSLAFAGRLVPQDPSDEPFILDEMASDLASPNGRPLTGVRTKPSEVTT